MASITAVLDACILYAAPVRDLLLQLSRDDHYRARWTDRIHAEWIAALRRRRPDIPHSRLERTRSLMNAHARDRLVVGFEPLIPRLRLPDPDDRHVLAAAIRCCANAIVTYNIGDFRGPSVVEHGIEIVHPDRFIVRLIDRSPLAACNSIWTHRARLRRPPKSVAEYLETLELHALSDTVKLLQVFRPLI